MGEKMIVKKAMNVAVNVGGNENASLPKRSWFWVRLPKYFGKGSAKLYRQCNPN
jgi:hypothetical protein